MLSQMVLAKEQQSDVAESSEQRKAQLDERERQFKASMEEMSQQREKLAKAEKVHDHLLENMFKDVSLSSPPTPEKHLQSSMHVSALKKNPLKRLSGLFSNRK